MPGEIDTKFLRDFRRLILKYIKRGDRFVLVIGGGQTCRTYQAALRSVFTNASDDDLDWMGIAVTRINAKLVRLMFGPLAHSTIIQDPNKKVAFREQILVAGGWKPGRSSDDDAVRLAKVYGAKTIINLTNIDYVYDKDPRKYKNTKRLVSLTWREYNRMFGNKWNPGANVPFDPIAARFAQRHQQQVIIANGKNLRNLESVLSSQKFKGTTIK